MSVRLRIRPAGAALILLASSAGAQDGSESAAQRTPESANRFLSTIFSQDDAGKVSYDVLVKDKTIVDDNFVGGEPRPVSGRLAALTADGDCKSRLQLRDAQVSNGPHWPLGTFVREIDWAKVAKVQKTSVEATDTTYGPDKQVTGQRVRTLHGLWIVMRNNWQKISLDTPSEEERDRAVFAVEFLRQRCAPAADTGF